MKLSLALPALLSVLGLAHGSKTISSASIQQRMKDGKFNKKSLLANAKPYDEATKRKLASRRKLEGDGEEEEEEGEFEINGYHSIHFDTCFNLNVEDEDLLDDDLISYAAKGKVVATKSFIIFNVCNTNDCSYGSDKYTFLTDVASFMQAFSEYLPNQVETYCQGCEENAEYCQEYLYGDGDGEEEADGDADGEADGDADGDGEEAADGEDDGERRLSKKKSRRRRRKLQEDQVIEYIDCDQCQEYKCYDEEEQQQQEQQDGEEEEEGYDFDDALEWLTALTECQQNDEGAQWNDMDLFTGFICASGGYGVEVGLFLDDECIVHAKNLKAKNYMSDADQAYYSMTSEIVEDMFTSNFDCNGEEVTYVNPNDYEEEEEDENQDEEEEDRQEDREASEFCQNVFDGEFEALSLYDCGYDNNEEQQEEEEEEEQQEDDEKDYDWYTYDLSEEQMDDEQEICLVVQALGGNYETVYDSGSSGSLYDYSKDKKNNKNKNKIFASETFEKVGKPILGLFIVLLFCLFGYGAYKLVMNGKETDTKKAPLIKEEPTPADGTMA